MQDYSLKTVCGKFTCWRRANANLVKTDFEGGEIGLKVLELLGCSVSHVCFRLLIDSLAMLVEYLRMNGVVPSASQK